MGIRRTKAKVTVGSVAPDFTLPSQSEEMVNLRDFLDRRPVVLFFYPKDNTLGCTKEVCAFRDSFEELGKLNAEPVRQGYRSMPQWTGAPSRGMRVCA